MPTTYATAFAAHHARGSTLRPRDTTFRPRDTMVHRPTVLRLRDTTFRRGDTMVRHQPTTTIVDALSRFGSPSCIIDGEPVACHDHGIGSFDLVRHHRANDSIFLYAFGLIERNAAP